MGLFVSFLKSDILYVFKNINIEIIWVKKMISCQYYKEFIKDFVKINTNMRQISPIHKIIGKNNNNSFYGRLGMNPEKLQKEILTNTKDINKYEKLIKINDIYRTYKNWKSYL